MDQIPWQFQDCLGLTCTQLSLGWPGLGSRVAAGVWKRQEQVPVACLIDSLLVLCHGLRAAGRIALLTWQKISLSLNFVQFPFKVGWTTIPDCQAWPGTTCAGVFLGCQLVHPCRCTETCEFKRSNKKNPPDRPGWLNAHATGRALSSDTQQIKPNKMSGVLSYLSSKHLSNKSWHPRQPSLCRC